MRVRKHQQRQSPASAVDDAAERLAAIVKAAEQAASRVIDDAEEQAQRILEEAHARADRIVGERLRELADQVDPPFAGDGERPARHLEPVEPIPEPEEPSAWRRSGSAGARLLATQMAISGAERAEIEARLRSGFEIDDTSAILDAILGPEE